MTVKESSDVTAYCSTVHSELTDMKGRIFDIMCKVEKMPEDRKNVLKPQYTEFFEIADFLDEKLSVLTNACPADWSAERDALEQKKKELREKINYWDAEHIPGGFVGG